MLSLPTLKHHQIAYVTTDLDEALRRLDQAFGLVRFYVFDTVSQPNHPNQPALRIALVRTAGTELEVIQPLGFNDAVYSDPLPKDGSFALLFHHIAVTFQGSMAEFEAYRASLDTTAHPIVVEGWMTDIARWFYTDERATLGHFIEHCWFGPELVAMLNAAVPRLGYDATPGG